MKILSFFLFLTVLTLNLNNIMAQDSKPVVYFIPGQGSDYRLFKNIDIDSSFKTKNIKYFTPDKDWNLRDFAKVLSLQIDTSHTFIIVGVSLGGMLATEMGSFLNPEKIIIISSAKCREELPLRYKFQGSVPVYKWVSGAFLKKGALFMQPIVEPDRKYNKETFISMLKDKDPDFLKRTVAMIMEWNRVKYREDIIHIHGDKDHTIPIRNVSFNYLIEKGSHMMVLTKGDEISTLINQILLKQ
ncbi:MAG: alpha/beta hydrolase [Bacteroidota bacterium]|nr:alpha/beta hydrolase [Bacteroidota bacterium]